MTLSEFSLSSKLANLEAVAGQPARYLVAFSGGLDSTVLLHVLARGSVPTIAIHVDHGLQPEAANWHSHCRQVAVDAGVEYRCLKVEVALDSGKGPEASAREARYSALRAEMEPGDWLLSAHHREDQAETLLLNLVRGSGPAGIAGIGELRRFAPGWLVRPLLDIERAALLEYAEASKLVWIDDPSNDDRRFDRNFLRHEVMPILGSRWPDIASRLNRSARNAGEASRLLQELAALDLDALGGRAERLPADGISRLSAARRKNLLRHALRQLGLPTPGEAQINRILDEVIPAREDAQPLVGWPGGEVRRYRGALYLLPQQSETLPEALSTCGSTVPLGAGLGTLVFDHDVERGLSKRLLARGLRLGFRRGGEQIKPYGHRHTRKLKKLLQDEGIVPWMRDRLPLLYAGDELVAVADLWLADSAVTEPGVGLRWIDRPALH
ncbi:MAG: tRNA lysidine(34) synthetase TilS [Gammaproteobacteria bacterium]|nr:tRNA lysidine(34) synthetase TilS [Gammaproteobacteria bacterium]